MSFSNAEVMKLREKTGAGVMDCKKALAQSEGDIEKAVEYLRKKGLELKARRASKAAKEGRVESYVHLNNKIGVLIELNCETDFVARTEDFKELSRDLAMQVAATVPLYIDKSEIPDAVIEKEKDLYRAQAEGKPEKVKDKIVEGKLEKFFQEVCLLNQLFIKDTAMTVGNYIDAKVAKIGENVVVRRFVRYQLGEEI
ncbi:MAG: translation elongation factor Ts [Candidatus Omnitrophota bacterium]